MPYINDVYKMHETIMVWIGQIAENKAEPDHILIGHFNSIGEILIGATNHMHEEGYPLMQGSKGEDIYD